MLDLKIGVRVGRKTLLVTVICIHGHLANCPDAVALFARERKMGFPVGDALLGTHAID